MMGKSLYLGHLLEHFVAHGHFFRAFEVSEYLHVSGEIWRHFLDGTHRRFGRSLAK